MQDSLSITQARSLIARVRDTTMPLDAHLATSIELAELMLVESSRIQTKDEEKLRAQLARMLSDPSGKAFTMTLADACFRAQDPARIADQIVYLLDLLGVPRYLSPFRRMQIALFRRFGRFMPRLLVPMVKKMVRKETATVILPGEAGPLHAHLKKRTKEDVCINLNHLGEAILGEEEAARRLSIYIEDLKDPLIPCISVKISTLYSQINLCSWEESLKALSSALRTLYTTALENPYRHADGSSTPKRVNLDMEEYRDLALTVDLFCHVLDEPAFLHYPAGIVLQAYLPDSFRLQKQLTQWATRRVKAGGAPIYIRLVKGANLAMEQVDAALHGWPQAPFCSKEEVDAQYKKMLLYGCQRQHARAVHIGVASHNLFDIAFALLLRSNQAVEKEVGFEMLEGMAESMRVVVQRLSHSMLLYCPCAKEDEFQNALAYLIRRLDENTAPQNFLRHAFSLEPGSAAWKAQVDAFMNAGKMIETVSEESRRIQDRRIAQAPPSPREINEKPFVNEPDTDWSLLANGIWIRDTLARWQKHSIPPIPVVIQGVEYPPTTLLKTVYDTASPKKPLYTYALASSAQVDKALECAKKYQTTFSGFTVQVRNTLLARIAHVLRTYRGDLIGAMMRSCMKTAFEADVEVSEAIDFAEYYRHNRVELESLTDVTFSPKGVALIAPPWNFPISIPAGGILAALSCGNCVLFKPAPEAVLAGWLLVQLFWEAGVPREALQFIPCDDDSVASRLVQDPRVNLVILTGATSTARKLLQLNPGLDLYAETGGKNSLIVTSMADKDLAIRDLIASAFGHAGQKCSACSLAILEKHVYEDPLFRAQLKSAAASLITGPSWNLSTRVPPLIRAPSPDLLRALTTLEPGEEWLLQPQQLTTHPHLWTPGIKLGVQPGSFTHMTELFGPVLGVMQAASLEHAIQLSNQVPYGLTAGIHSLDPREQEKWASNIQAGNLYINRSITGAVVQRQPFGGCKESSFGRGAKAGGPNYLLQCMKAEQRDLPTHLDLLPAAVESLDRLVRTLDLPLEQCVLWQRSLGSYAFFWNYHFSISHDPTRLLGEDNLFYYRAAPLNLRVQRGDKRIDLYRVCAAALICQTPIEVSGEPEALEQLFADYSQKGLVAIAESESAFIERLKEQSMPRVRLLSPPSAFMQTSLAKMGATLLTAPVMANGRVELPQYLREVALSISYHRYGNLGLREDEVRAPLFGTPDRMTPDQKPCAMNSCAGCCGGGGCCS